MSRRTSDAPAGALEERLAEYGCKFGRSIGCSTCEGWWPILDRLVVDLFALGWDGQVRQIKEKFGGLRVYVGATSEAIEARINRATEESLGTCEICGDPGTTAGPGWVKTHCDPCRTRWATGWRPWRDTVEGHKEALGDDNDTE